MTLAFDQASSLVTGWVRSCWECLSGVEPQGQQGQRPEGRGMQSVTTIKILELQTNDYRS
jgi:hypothetical protein